MWIKTGEIGLISTKILSSITPYKKRKLKKIFLIPYSTRDELSNDTSLNSLRWIYRSAKIHETKKNPFEYIVPPSSERGRNNNNNIDTNTNIKLTFILILVQLIPVVNVMMSSKIIGHNHDPSVIPSVNPSVDPNILM